jgi:hypothetical protein
VDLLVRGQYVITDAGDGEAGILDDAAVLVSGGKVSALGDWRSLRRRHPKARPVGNGKQLLMPGLVDAHSHGRALSPIQKGVLNDYLENNLLDWMFMPVFEPALTAALGAWRHLRFEAEQKDDTYHRVERVYGKFERSVPLPLAVQSDKVKATYRDGVLEVRLPKVEQIKPKQIKIDLL